MKRVKNLGLVFMIGLSCTKPSNEEIQLTSTCSIIEIVEEESIAKSAILGNWGWWNTAYNFRGSDPRNETPENTGKRITYYFDNKKLEIQTNNTKETKAYEIKKFEKEGPLFLVIKEQTGEIISTGLLQIDVKNRCMKIVFSYNDAGGDLSFSLLD